MRLITIISTVVLALNFLFACHNGNKAMETSAKTDTPKLMNPPAQSIVPINETPPASASKKAYLSTGYWVPLGAMQPSDSTVFQQYSGKSLKFKEDQTFDLYKFGKIVESGAWNFDDRNAILYLSCKDPYFNSTWQVIDKSFTMVWIGQTDRNRSGIQIKIKSVKELPTN